MIRSTTAVGQALDATGSGHGAGSSTTDGQRPAEDADVVEISEECKNRYIMGALKAALLAVDGVKGRER